MSTAPERELLQRFLEAYWLRPENALWMYLRSRALATFPLDGPSADLSCGDGIFTFLHQGGILDPSFDVFGALRPPESSAAAALDLFDQDSDDYVPKVIRPPISRIDMGTDLKKNLLAKAHRLNLYHRLVEHDHNRRLPFADGAFKSIYCNSAYWIEEIDDFLAEVRRVTTPSGRAILHVKLDTFREFTVSAFREVLGSRFLERIVGRRLESWPTLASRKEWERRFVSAGFTITSATVFATAIHARIWEVGLRPVAPLLIQMANAMTPSYRARIKAQWVELFLDLAEPLCKSEFSAQDAVEMQYVLSPCPS